MVNGTEGMLGHFRAPRIPFDLRCLLLAAGGFLVMGLVNEVLALLFGTENPLGYIFSRLAHELGRIAFFGEAFRYSIQSIRESADAGALNWYQTLGTVLAFLAVWGIFGGAILRTCALRLTRDEPLTLKQGLAFGFGNVKDFVLAPALVALIVVVFALCNMLAGLLAGIPFLGTYLLVLIFVPMALISTLCLVLAFLGGVVGFPLMWSGLSVEVNGPLEAFSRAFSYLFARPLQFLFSYLLLFLLMSVVLFVGDHFQAAAQHTIGAGMGVWSADLEAAVNGGGTDFTWIYQSAYWVAWFMLAICGVLFKGYAIYVFFGGSASLYLTLRREVDGTDEEEIFLGENDPGRPASGDGGSARWVGDRFDKDQVESTDAPGKSET
jgi:hypothetical protein